MSVRKTFLSASILMGVAVAPTLAHASSILPTVSLASSHPASDVVASVNQAVVVSIPIYDENGNLIEVRFEYSLVCDPDFNCQV